ncbi:MAG: FixH family protein [Phycisphaeraceae bacterium]
MTNADSIQSRVDQTALKKTQKRRFIMPAVVLGLLGGHMIFIFTAIAIGTGDPSFAVVPDYYQKAVDYDEKKALLAESAELGWTVELMPSDTADAIGQRELIVQLRDASGKPVRNRVVKIDGFHQARASQPISMTCVEVLPGQYVGKGLLTREGFWQFTVDAASEEASYIAEVKQFLPPAKGSE